MRVLITGGTGSLGHALVRHYLTQTEHRVIVLSRDEYKQARMREQFPSDRLDFFLGDVRDEARLARAFSADVDVVIHAAALKRVDSVCHDPDEVLQTNVLGARNVLHAAVGRVGRVLLISTDKACYPTNAYGRTKALAEDLFTAFNVYGYPKGTLSSVVRYGNVLGSRGSVLEAWRQQAERGEPLTITHPDMTRFLITMPRAVGVVGWALERMTGGETIVPMLRAVRVVDLAAAAFPGAKHNMIGLRPGGEKLHETLITQEEAARGMLSPWDRYGIISPVRAPWRAPMAATGPGLFPMESSDPTLHLSVAHIRDTLEREAEV